MKVKMITTMAGPDGGAMPKQTIEVDPAKAKELVEGGFATYVDQPQAEKSTAPATPLTMAEIVEAIGKMDKADSSLWTAGNSPQVKALAEILGRDVTADQRNEAWAAVLLAEEEAKGGQE
jgi:hypothetical protein